MWGPGGGEVCEVFRCREPKASDMSRELDHKRLGAFQQSMGI
jgi:hypothetical protein